jgi:hypothetical protein
MGADTSSLFHEIRPVLCIDTRSIQIKRIQRKGLYALFDERAPREMPFFALIAWSGCPWEVPPGAKARSLLHVSKPDRLSPFESPGLRSSSAMTWAPSSRINAMASVLKSATTAVAKDP